MATKVLDKADLVPALAQAIAAEHVGALTPRLPPLLARVLDTGIETLFRDDGTMQRVERVDWQMPVLDAHGVGVKLARDWLMRFTENLSPVEPERLSMMLAVFLAHRWRGRSEADQEMEPIVREAVAGDWVADLAEFPSWAVEAAMRTWRRTEEWHPTIAGIRRLAEAEVADDRRTLRLLNRLLGEAAT